MQLNKSTFDELYELIEDSLMELNPLHRYYKPDKDQPKHFSWVSLDLEFQKYCQDHIGTIGYTDAQDMQIQLLRWVKAIVTPELLDYVRSGEIRQLTVRIGPHTLSGSNLNEDY